MEYMDIEFEPDPIQSYSKLDQVHRFQRQEDARQARHRNDPASTRLLEVGLVLVFIAILIALFLLYIKFCHTAPSASKRKANYSVKGGRWIPVPINSGEEETAPTSTGLFLPTQMPLVPLKGPVLKCPKPACVCGPSGGGGKTKGWTAWRKSKNDDESYGPSRV